MSAALQLEDSGLSEIYRYILDETAIISITDANGNITYINENFAEISGYTSSELVGKNHRIINSGFHSKSFFENMWATINNGSIWKGDVKNKTKDGSFYWVSTMIMPLLDENNKVESFLSVRFDITGKKRVEELLAFFVDESHRVGGQKFFSQVVKKFCDFLDFEYGFLAEYFVEDHTLSTQALIAKGGILENTSFALKDTPCDIAVKEKKPLFYTEGVQAQFPKDKYLVDWGVHSYMSFPLLDNGGELLGTLTFFGCKKIDNEKLNLAVQLVDHFNYFIIQEMKRLKSDSQVEYQKKVIDEMEKLSSMGTLAAFLGHEINNSLQIIFGNIARIEKNLAEHDCIPEKVTKSLTNINKVSQNLSLIVKGIKTLSHSGEQQVQEEIFFREIIEENIPLVELKNKECGATIDIAIPDTVVVFGNKTQLGQVIVNILTNALDAISHLEEKWVKIEYSERGDDNFFYFVDSGLGVTKEESKKIFDEFYTTKAVGKGTGLGLSVVRKIALEHRGDFYIDHTNKNTSFCLSLPKINRN